VAPLTRSPASQGVNLDDYPHVQRWFERIAERPAVKRGLRVLAREHDAAQNEESRFDNLFGSRQFQRR